MKELIETVIGKMEQTWGIENVQDADRAVACFDKSLRENVSNPLLQRAIAGLFLKGLRECGYNSQSMISFDTAKMILDNHVKLGTALYLITAYWSHHCDADESGGSSEDYCEHQFKPTTMEMFDSFENAKDLAVELLEIAIDQTPNQVTNIRTEVAYVDNEISIVLGEWVWDKASARKFWAKPHRN